MVELQKSRQSDGATLNWEDELERKSNLRKETSKLLRGSGEVELSKYNQSGYYHKVNGIEEFRSMRECWDMEREVSQDWITKGNFPGIWTAMFNPNNTFSIATMPIGIVRFYFKEGFFLYDSEKAEHRKLLEGWHEAGENPWKSAKNERGRSLESRLINWELPSSKNFYVAHNFGAVVGYANYISVVILLENSISNVEFIEL